MPLPEPIPGLVIRYSYLWASEHRSGRDEGFKDRPCAVILVTVDDSGDQVVTVLPITHTPPSNPDWAVEIPYQTKRRLGLDNQSSWIVISEANRFVWPGPDIRLGPAGDSADVAFGLLPRALFNTVRDKLARAIEKQLIGIVTRTQ